MSRDVIKSLFLAKLKLCEVLYLDGDTATHEEVRETI